MKAFIFDMDGVIIDSEPLHSRVKLETLKKYGLDFSESRLSYYMGRATKELFGDAAREAGRTDLDIGEMVDYKHAAYLEHLRNDDTVQPITGVRELIAALKAKHIPIGLASSAGQVVIDAVLKKFVLEDSFAAILSGAELKRSKPNPEIYLLTAKRLNVAPADCTVLEDAASGIAAAKAAGMYCIAYRNPNSGNQDLSRADIVVENIDEVIRLL